MYLSITIVSQRITISLKRRTFFQPLKVDSFLTLSYIYIYINRRAQNYIFFNYYSFVNDQFNTICTFSIYLHFIIIKKYILPLIIFFFVLPE